MNKPDNPERDSIKAATSCVILAGGQAKRMQGRDKGWIKLNDLPLITHTIERIKGQTSSVAINANRHLNEYRQLGFPVCSDLRTGFLGPLAGMEAGLSIVDTPWALFVPCDAPFLPLDLNTRLHKQAHAEQADIVVVKHQGFVQPVFILLRSELNTSLSEFLDRGERKIMLWVRAHRWSSCEFDDPPQAFANLNSPEDLQGFETKR